MPVGDARLHRENRRHLPPSALPVEIVEDVLEAQEHATAGDHEQATPALCKRAVLRLRRGDQAKQAEDREQHDRQRQIGHGIDEQRLAPIGGATVEMILQPDKGEDDRRDISNRPQAESSESVLSPANSPPIAATRPSPTNWAQKPNHDQNSRADGRRSTGCVFIARS